ncbi:MAG: 23S rRNA (adenine(2503)-C(2))-methyltransferase RlmN [Polyangiaceae bacterium]|nr:23S rRNA (adenine(2503)-C(2))-methyltransferase RlmN [Polyangiaceae bacterium]
MDQQQTSSESNKVDGSTGELLVPSVADATVTRGKSPEEIHPLARTLEEWVEVFRGMGEKPFRAKQVYRWLHQDRVFDPDQMTNLSKALREKLKKAGVAAPGQVANVHESADGTRKILIDFVHGAKIECVMIPMSPDIGVDDYDEEEEDSPKKRVTLCISTQFGCAMGCVFCASGQSGLFRGLGAAEVVFQVLVARDYLRPGEELKNLVFMGMGEPLHHYEETERSLRLIARPEGIGMSPRRVTVSTVGLVPGIRRLGRDFDGKVGLAVSLHATNDAVRSEIMPMNKRYPIAELMKVLHEYPLPPRKRLTIEYTLIKGKNDSLEDADALARLLRSLRVKVNLIPMNPIEKSNLEAPEPKQVLAFRERLAAAGISCFVRMRKGDDVSAACGQLALQSIDPQRLTRRSPRS